MSSACLMQDYPSYNFQTSKLKQTINIRCSCGATFETRIKRINMRDCYIIMFVTPCSKCGANITMEDK